jgi:hypothetical protein
MPQTLPTEILNGALRGGLGVGLLGILYCVWLSKEFRNQESEPEPIWAVVRVLLTIIGIFMAVGAIAGGIMGGLGIILPKEIVIGGLVVGSVGILFGTWLSISYGRERGDMPTPFAALFFWVTFGVLGCITGSVVGGILSIL